MLQEICSSEWLAVLRVPPNDGGRAKPARESGTVGSDSTNGEGERAVAILGTVRLGPSLLLKFLYDSVFL